MKYFVYVILILFTLQVGIIAEKVDIQDLVFPQLIRANSDNLYIVEREKIHIYSLNPFKKVCSFGKLGEGPQEFRVHPGTPIMLSPVKNRLIASTGGSIYYYKKNGKYIREKKIQGQFMASVKPAGSNFVGLTYGNLNKKRYMKIILVNGQFKKIKDLSRTLDEKQKGQGLDFLSIPQHMYTCYAVDEKFIYTSLGTEMSIKIFDHNGKLIRTISIAYEKQKVNATFKKEIVHHYKTDPFLKQFYNYLSPISFPESFPAIRDIRVSDNKIYAVTYKMKKDKSEVLIFNTNGNLIKTIYLPIKEQNVRLFYPYDINNGRLYQTVESDEETYELFITPI